MVSRPPSVDTLAGVLDDGTLPRPLLVEIARRAIAEHREDAEPRAREEVARLDAGRLRRVVNATGVILHTNLGRARLANGAVAAASLSGAHPNALEFDLAAGRRGGRGEYAHRLLSALTGAEAALVVNNTAGALLLALAALSGDGEAIVSRGELIEIGGSFRLPELMSASGARLAEVGTTNRTRLKDYRKAIGPDTRVILKVHPSNYRIEGFTAEATYGELGDLASEHRIPFVADLGSGLLDARVPWLDGPPPAWTADEPAVRQTLAAGASVALFSGDKLLGGPQAGIAVGSADVIETMRSHPIARAVRIAGPMLDALGATLELYANGRADEIPFWRTAALPVSSLAERAGTIASLVGDTATVVEDRSLPGAGTVPGQGIPGPVVLVADAPQGAWRTLLAHDPPIVTRRDDRGLVVDPRTIDPEDDAVVAAALAAACR
jgi:L-seryl-tRNA(Ser) seleniumtransferase